MVDDSYLHRSDISELTMVSIKPTHEARVLKFVQAGQTDKAVDLLFQMAIACAKEGQFNLSESYRDRLYEVDSMALSSIVAVNEAIEAQKSKQLPPDYRQQWASFFDALSEQEASTFFFALKKVEVDSDRIIIKQGQPNDRLYLVNQGHLKAVYLDQQKELLLRKIGPSDIFGEDTFFSVNVCTATIKTMTPTVLSYLTYPTLEDMHHAYPDLLTNLKTACASGQSLTECIRRKGIDRRSFKRYKVRGKVLFQLLESGNPKSLNRPVTAEIWDISKGGLSFYIHSKNREAVRKLIGQTLNIKFNLDIDGKSNSVNTTGVVHGVGIHPMEEYSIHLKLTRQFSASAIKAIARIAS